MSLKKCRECGREISTLAPSCPHCGAPQQDYETFDKNVSNADKNKMSKTKVLSLVALGLAVFGGSLGGIFGEIAALVISIIVLKSKDECEKETRTIAIVALIISIILTIICIIAYVYFARFYISTYRSIKWT